MSHGYIFVSVAMMVYSQAVIKWQMNGAGPMPPASMDKITFLLSMLFNGWILSAILASVLSMFSWMAAMTRFPVSYAYPFVSLSFVGVALLGVVLFKESLGWTQIAGMVLIVGGVILIAQPGQA